MKPVLIAAGIGLLAWGVYSAVIVFAIVRANIELVSAFGGWAN